MASDKLILEALNDLSERMLELETMAEMCLDLVGDQAGGPATRWTFLVSRHVRPAVEAADRVRDLVHQVALPVLKDLSAAKVGKLA